MKFLQHGTQERTTSQGLWLIAMMLDCSMLVAYFLGPWWLGASQKASFTICLFRHLTGHYCPFCGMTRAFTAAMHGDIIRSIGENPMGIGLILLGIFITVCQGVSHFFKLYFKPGFWIVVAKITGLLLAINWLYLFFTK